LEYSDLVLNRKEVNILGVAVTLRLHSVAFRNYSQLLALEGRRIEQEPGEDGQTMTRIVDAGTMEQYRKIVRATVADGVAKWALKTSDGTEVGVSDSVLLDLEDKHPEFLAAVFDAIAEFNTPLSAAKKKT